MSAYEIYVKAMLDQGIEVDDWDSLDIADKNAWILVEERFAS